MQYGDDMIKVQIIHVKDTINLTGHEVLGSKIKEIYPLLCIVNMRKRETIFDSESSVKYKRMTCLHIFSILVEWIIQLFILSNISTHTPTP